MYALSISLLDTPSTSPLAAGIGWIEGVALGEMATLVAVVAIASIGLLMLSGRLHLRRGVVVILGCFIVFGASSLASALVDMRGAQPVQPAPNTGGENLARQVSASSDVIEYDPYAGASVPSVRP